MRTGISHYAARARNLNFKLNLNSSVSRVFVFVFVSVCVCVSMVCVCVHIMEEGSSVRCSCVAEYLDEGGQTLRKQPLKAASLALVRNELGDVAVRITHANGSLGPLTVRQHTIHRRFVNQGKASIRLSTQKMQLLVSNCPPAELRQFLRSLSLKVAARGRLQGARSRILPDSALGFDEISPLCERDLEKAAKNSVPSSNLVTPKREEGNARAPKRKLSDVTNSTPRRANTANSSANQPTKRPRTSDTILKGIHSNLSAEQVKVLEMVKNGESVFFTGSAGTGKSYLLRQIVSILPPDSTFATASTGSAACQIGGTTLHAFAGIGSGGGTVEQCVELASRPRKAAQWRKCACLIIDEISMVDADYFDKLDAVGKAVRRSKRPFGGIQLVLCGDFLQLPPVAKEGEKKYCFQAKCWKWCVTRSVELTEIYRQSDKQFIALLQNIRIGRCPPAISKLLQGTKHQQIETGGIKATRLYTHTADVAATNKKQLSVLQGELHKFPAQDSDPALSSQLDTLCSVPSSLHLKIGAQVMLAKNIDVGKGLVNGARGVVVKFNTSQRGYPVVRYASGLEMTVIPEKFLVKTGGGVTVIRRQLPLRLAWAISVHKSQGMTLDCVEISLGRAFEDGQAYVALSRARSLKCMRVTDFQPSCVRAHPAVLEFYRFLRRTRQNYISPLSP